MDMLYFTKYPRLIIPVIFFLLALTQVVEGGPGEGAPALDVCPLLQAEILNSNEKFFFCGKLTFFFELT